MFPMMCKFLLALNMVVAAAAASDYAAPRSNLMPTFSLRHRLLAPISVGVRSAITSRSQQYGTSIAREPSSIKFTSDDVNVAVARGGGRASGTADNTKPPTQFLRWAYTAAGAATTAAWSTMVYTTIRSNQPQGAMMPCAQHAIFARIGAMSAAGLIAGSFASLAVSASNADSWEELGANSSFRRHNLALATTGIASSLWVRFAPLITKIPGTNPLVSHQSYSGIMQARLIGCYGSAATLGAAVWVRSLPENVRNNPLSWPKRVLDGMSKSLLSIAPKDIDDPVQVKYSLLTSSFLIFTAMQTVCNMPISVIPSWTSRRLSRAFPIYTFLGAVTAFDLKEATENGRLLIDEKYRCLSNGVKAFGGLYLGARAGAVFLDPSFPEHFGMVNQVPGLAVAAIAMVGLTLRSDEK